MNWLHELDCGDVIYGAAVVQAGGGGNYFLKRTKPIIHALLRDLFGQQEYIHSFRFHNGEHVDKDFSTFRAGGIPFGRSLADVHAKWVGVEVDSSKPWLKVSPSVTSSGKIVVARSPRYNNQFFPWKDLTESLYHKMLFVGLESEWSDFCHATGRYVEYVRTANLLQVAELIAGSELFIGNQSSPYALCEGLKHASVQETSLHVPDCIYLRENASYCSDGKLAFEFLGKRYEFDPVKCAPRLNRGDAPPGGWSVEVGGQVYKSFSRDQIIACVERDMGRSNVPTDIHTLIDHHTIKRLGLDEIPKVVREQIAAVNQLLN